MDDFSLFLSSSEPGHMLGWVLEFDSDHVLGRTGDCSGCPVTRWFLANGFNARVGIGIAFFGQASLHITLPVWVSKVVDNVDDIWTARERAWISHNGNQIGLELTREQANDLERMRLVTAGDLIGVLRLVMGGES